MTRAKLAEASVTESKLVDASVTGAKLAEASITESKLSDASVTGAKLAVGSVSSAHIADGSITLEKLAPGLFSEPFAQQMDEEYVGLSALTFNPVIAPSGRGVVKQQFGLCPYNFIEQKEMLSVFIEFDEPFESDDYVFTASSDHPSCYAVIQNKQPDSAVVSLIRTRIGQEPSGCINWIAIGR
ncbi:WIAG-tail domain [Paenibacillus sp. NPDC058071]|uniref:WIAG-tail domain n=1 Tax=Paenibacillus sp. NPDC058071 TaxID=3346326 RepID=UPI0036D888C9